MCSPNSFLKSVLFEWFMSDLPHEENILSLVSVMTLTEVMLASVKR